MTEHVLTIHQGPDEVRIWKGDDGPITLALNPGALRPAVREFVTEVNRCVASLSMSAEIAWHSLTYLSNAAYDTLVGATLATHRELGRQWNQVLDWLQGLPGSQPGEIPRTVVDIKVGSADYLPWEWIGPPFPTDRPAAEKGEWENRLTADAGRLLGMAMCQRSYVDTTSWSPPHSVRPAPAEIQVRGFFNRDLPAALEEIEYFEEDGYRLIAPLPEPCTDFTALLAHQLFDPAHYVDGASVGTDQVVHFCCHHEPLPATSSEFDMIPTSALVFDPSTSVATNALNKALGRLWRQPPSEESGRPLVFLNLCAGEIPARHPDVLDATLR